MLKILKNIIGLYESGYSCPMEHKMKTIKFLWSELNMHRLALLDGDMVKG